MSSTINSAQCRLLDWDTAFFGRRIGKIEGSDLNAHDMQLSIDWATAHDIACLYYCCTIDSDQAIRIAEQYQFHLVDVKVEMALELSKQQLHNTDHIQVRPYRIGELPQLEAIDDNLFKNGRFYHDPQFSREQASSLYREWLNKCCRENAETVFVAEYENRIAGFITFRKEISSVVHIDLIGVSSKIRSMGIGSALIKAMCDYCINNEVKEIRVVTQGRNIAAQRLFQSQGFHTASLALWYHRWF